MQGKSKRIQMRRANKEAKKSFVIEPRKDIRDTKDTKDAEGTCAYGLTLPLDALDMQPLQGRKQVGDTCSGGARPGFDVQPLRGSPGFDMEPPF